MMRAKAIEGERTSPIRVLEMLMDKFGAFESIAYSSIKLARALPDEAPPMDLLVAEAVLEFGDDLRDAAEAAAAWAGSRP
ncbi:hypothetical protein [Longimicrobium sp.]|jgi:hypothetical protein|uniref:hypothetical protein n=1 Tax=Longimicrobium sp. TaxID=2029185 RepID=UPI002ED8476C